MWREIAIQILLKWYVYQVVCLGHIATVTACNMGPNDRLFYKCSYNVELAWRSGCVMDCHATTQGSIPGRDCKTRASRPSHRTVNGVPSLNDLAVDGTLNTTNQPTMECHAAGTRRNLTSSVMQ